MTPHQWERMSWHARQRHLEALRREVAQLEERLAGYRTKAATRREVAAITAEQATREAARILATLPPDPEAEQHRNDLWQATRKDPAA